MLYTFCNSVPYGGRDLCGCVTVLIDLLTNWVASVLACTSCSTCASGCRTMSAVILHYCIIVLTCACGSYLCQLCLYSIYGMLLVLEPGVLVGKSSNNYLSISYSVLQKNHSYIIHRSVHPFRHLFGYLLKPSLMSFDCKRYKHPELFPVYASTL